MFYLKLARFFISTKKWISVTVLFSLMMAYLLPVMLLSGVQAGLEQLQSEEQKEAERVLRYTKTAVEYQKELGEQLQAEAAQENGAEVLSCAFYINTDVVVADTVQRRGVYAVDEQYAQFYDWKVTWKDGENFENKADNRVCLLEEELYRQCAGEGNEPEVVIDGVSYRVIGSTTGNGIYIPYRSLKRGSRGNSLVFIRTREENQNVSLSSLAGYRMEREAERQGQIKSVMMNNVKTIGTILTVLFLFVVLNLTAIWREQYMQLRTVLGVQRAVGLSRSGLFLEQWIQSFLMSFGAIVVLYIFSPVLNRIFAGFGEIRFSWFAFAAMLAAGAVLGLLQSAVVTVFVCRQPVREMLESA